jgi:uncharacterized protein (TIGR02594 family)
VKFFEWLKSLFKKPATKPVDQPSTNPKWYDLALGEMDQAEISGSKDNPRIVEYHSVTSLSADDDETPWCASFVSWCLEKSGVKSTKSARAKSYMEWGSPLNTPKLGCIAVFTRTGGGHVAFFISESATHVRVLGGNQGNKVSIASYSKANLLGYRWP